MKKSELKKIIMECLEEEAPDQINSMYEKTNPWAVCTASVGREDKDKYEKCVKGVKKTVNENDVITEAFSRQHYVEIANIIHSLKGTVEQAIIDHLVSRFVDLFKSDNPRFDQSKFESYAKR